MEKVYKELNYLLSKIFKNNRENDFFSIDNLYTFLDIARTIDDVSEKLPTCKVVCKDELDLVESLKIVRDFLDTINPNYTKIFDLALTKGDIHFISDELFKKEKNLILLTPERRRQEDEKKFDSYVGVRHNYKTKEEYILMNIYLKNNYEDPSTIVHEFFHYIARNKDFTISHLYNELTEFVSIYFENMLLNYMEEQNYNIDEINKVRLIRKFDTLNAISNERNIIPTYLCYKLYGDFNEFTYDLVSKTQNDKVKFYGSKEEWNSFIIDILRVIRNRNDQLNDKHNNSSRYILGDILATNMREYKPNDVIRINRELTYNNESIRKTLNIIADDLYDDDKVEKTEVLVEKDGIIGFEIDRKEPIFDHNHKYKYLIENYINETKKLFKKAPTEEYEKEEKTSMIL